MRALRVVSLLSCLVACSCSSSEPPKRHTPDAAAVAMPKPLANTTAVMREFNRLAEEMSHRAGQFPVDSPARRLALITANLPEGKPREEVRTRALALIGSTQAKRDFNGLLDACQSCHRTGSSGRLMVDRLRVTP